MADVVFPEDAATGAPSGDSGSAALFASLLEAATSDVVIRGLELTPDFVNNTLSVSAGKAAVQVSGLPSGNGTTHTGIIVAEVDARTGLTLTEGAYNVVWLTIDLTVGDSVSITITTDGTAPAGVSGYLRLGVIDTTNDYSWHHSRSDRKGELLATPEAIHNALVNLSDGDHIRIAPGHYRLTGNPYTINAKNITIEGSGWGDIRETAGEFQTTLKMEGAGDGLVFMGKDPELRNLTIAGQLPHTVPGPPDNATQDLGYDGIVFEDTGASEKPMLDNVQAALWQGHGIRYDEGHHLDAQNISCRLNAGHGMYFGPVGGSNGAYVGHFNGQGNGLSGIYTQSKDHAIVMPYCQNNANEGITIGGDSTRIKVWCAAAEFNNGTNELLIESTADTCTVMLAYTGTLGFTNNSTTSTIATTL